MYGLYSSPGPPSSLRPSSRANVPPNCARDALRQTKALAIPQPIVNNGNTKLMPRTESRPDATTQKDANGTVACSKATGRRWRSVPARAGRSTSQSETWRGPPAEAGRGGKRCTWWDATVPEGIPLVRGSHRTDRHCFRPGPDREE